MPGSTSDSYPGPPICACGHFKELHYADFDNYPVLRDPGPCQGEGCTCQDFQPVDMAETELGQATNAFIRQMDLMEAARGKASTASIRQIAASPRTALEDSVELHDRLILEPLSRGAYLKPGEVWTVLEQPGQPEVSIATRAFQRYQEAGWIHEPEPGRWHITVKGRRALENHS